MENKICVYAICKNEEKFVDGWVKSMREADAIVVLDTGSSDGTVDRLRSLGVFVVQKEITPWRFDVARNEALQLVPADCNILVSTDLDELFEAGWADKLREKWIEGHHERAQYKYTWSHKENEGTDTTFIYEKIHSWNWIWRYPVHEMLWNPKTKSNYYDIKYMLDLTNDIHLHHYPDQTKSRSSYLPLLELRVEENLDGDEYGRFYLAREYYFHGIFDKAITLASEIIMQPNNLRTIEVSYLCCLIGECLEEFGCYDDALAYYMRGVLNDPTYRDSYMKLGRLLRAVGRNSFAGVILDAGIQRSYRHNSWVEDGAYW